MVSSQAIADATDDDDFDVAKSQPGFPSAKKKRCVSQTRFASSLGLTPKIAKTGSKKPGSSSARRTILSDSDSDFDMEKYAFPVFRDFSAAGRI